MATLIDDYFGDRAKVGASLLSVSDQIDTRTAAGRLVLNILASVSQWEREAIGERTKTAMQHMKASGATFVGPSLGETDEERATVSRIIELRQQELSFRDIASRLSAEGFRTKRGGQWASETVRKVVAPEVAG
jgi:DNA invertase Pin-like site-specific DNA recombinase